MEGDDARYRIAILKVVDFEMHERILRVLKALMARPKAREFNRPVVGIDGYTLFIKEPMDLGRVQENLRHDLKKPYAEKTYQYAEEFAHDVRLVFKNCFLFNAATHHVFGAGKHLALRFEETYGEEMHRFEKNGPRVSLRFRCQLLLTDLRRHPMSEWFRRDDWRAYGDDYLSRLTSGKPMDLDEVQARMERDVYHGGASQTPFDIDAFAADVRLIWQNAIDFNTEASNFGTMAKVLQLYFNMRLEHLKKAPQQQAAASSAEVAAMKRQRELLAVCTSLPSASAADLAKWIEEEHPAAVKRRTTRDHHAAERVDVNLDALDEAAGAALAERAKLARAAAPPGLIGIPSGGAVRP
jgi:hypothetical protein